MKKQTHLKSMTNGRVFLFSDTLASRTDMIPCNAEGKIAGGEVGNATAIDATMTRRKTKYLGNVKNGVLYPYTDFLAERDDMVSIDTEDQWEQMKKTGKAPEQVADVVAPVLTREPTKPATAPSADTNKVNDQENPKVPEPAAAGTALPNIDGMGAREAKTALSDWAKMNFGEEIDRRPKLTDVLETCKLLAMKKMDKAAGQ